MYRIIDKLKQGRVRDSTKSNYYIIWKAFNKFFLKLDVKPPTWEERLVLYAGYLIDNKRQSQTVRNYISAIKNILRDDGIEVNEDRFLLTSLTRACRLKNDRVITRLPIQKGLLSMLLTNLELYFEDISQPYLLSMYQALFATLYYGLFHIGELTQGPHTIKVKDIQLAMNKDKILFILRTLKTHGLGSKPQKVKINSRPARNKHEMVNAPTQGQIYSPFKILRRYMVVRPKYDQKS